MTLNRHAGQTRWHWLLVALVACAIGFSTAHVLWERPSIGADVRQSEPREAFKSGGARSEAVLREISATLKKIDSRLERIERSAAKLAEK